MGAYATAANTAFRDYVTDGVPTSGAHKPLKSDIRSLFGLIDAALVTASDTGQGLVELATEAEYRAGSATNRALTPASVFGDCGVLTDAATIAVDLATDFDFSGASNAPLALGGNRSLGAPSNAKNGQKGILWFGATGSTRTLTLNVAWTLINNVETGPYSIATTQMLGVAYAVRGTTVYVTGILRTG